MKEELSWTTFYMVVLLYILSLYACYTNIRLWLRRNRCDYLISQNMQVKYLYNWLGIVYGNWQSMGSLTLVNVLFGIVPSTTTL